MNRCEQIQFKILKNASLSPEERNHLDACPECRRFAEFDGKMRRLAPLEKEVPAHLDAAVLSAARAAVPTFRRTPVFWKIVLSAAAVFVLAAGILFVQPSGELPAEKSTPETASPGFALNQEKNFEDQILALAADVGTGADSFQDTIDFMI